MTSKEARTYVCKPGYWLKDISDIGEEPNWIEEVMPVERHGILFGYKESEFLARQYKS